MGGRSRETGRDGCHFRGVVVHASAPLGGLLTGDADGDLHGSVLLLGPLMGNPKVAGHPADALTGARHVPLGGSGAAAGAGLVGWHPPAVGRLHVAAGACWGLLGPQEQLTGLGPGLLGDSDVVAKGGGAGVMTTIGPLGTGGWGSALGTLGGFGGQVLLVLPPLTVPLPVPGGPLLRPRRRAAAALQPALAPRFRELLLDHVPHGDVDRGARRVGVGVLVLLNPVGAQPFAGPVRPGPGPPAPLLVAVLVPFRPQPVLHGLQAVGGDVRAELEAPGHAAFALGVAVAVVLVPNQPTQQLRCMGVGPRPRPTRFLPIHHGSGGVVGLEVLGVHSFNSTNWLWLLRRVLQHWIGSAAGAGQPVVVEVVDAALLVGRWDSWSADGADAGVLVCAPLSRLLRGQGDALDGAAGSVTNSALSLSGAASRCAALRDAALRCELRAAPRCCDALLGVGGPEWHARAG